MLKIRLQRVGKKNSPSYRVVLAEHTAPPQGKFQEILGFYNPRKKQKGFKKDRIEHWLSKGAQLSPTVHNLLIDEKVLTGIKLRAWRPKKRSEAKSSEAPGEGGAKKEEKPQAEKPVEETKTEKPKEVESLKEEVKDEETAKEEVKEEKEEKSVDKKS